MGPFWRLLRLLQCRILQSLLAVGPAVIRLPLGTPRDTVVVTTKAQVVVGRCHSLLSPRDQYPRGVVQTLGHAQVLAPWVDTTTLLLGRWAMLLECRRVPAQLALPPLPLHLLALPLLRLLVTAVVLVVVAVRLGVVVVPVVEVWAAWRVPLVTEAVVVERGQG